MERTSYNLTTFGLTMDEIKKALIEFVDKKIMTNCHTKYNVSFEYGIDDDGDNVLSNATVAVEQPCFSLNDLSHEEASGTIASCKACPGAKEAREGMKNND